MGRARRVRNTQSRGDQRNERGRLKGCDGLGRSRQPRTQQDGKKSRRSGRKHRPDFGGEGAGNGLGSLSPEGEVGPHRAEVGSVHSAPIREGGAFAFSSIRPIRPIGPIGLMGLIGRMGPMFAVAGLGQGNLVVLDGPLAHEAHAHRDDAVDDEGGIVGCPQVTAEEGIGFPDFCEQGPIGHDFGKVLAISRF